MGYSTLIHIQNDSINKLWNNPDAWVDGLRQAMSEKLPALIRIRRGGEIIDSCGRVIRMDHDDECTLHMVGGSPPNDGTSMLNLHYTQLCDEDNRTVEACRLWAKSLGYRLVKVQEAAR